ncbi:MAG TPA: hypothetical protein VK636_19865, partial [Gemmatimonadaceae bacterium]|nr:hypothetical protein [Gemmatimonadaceae bacterium]
VLRVLASDTLRIVALKRSPLVNQDVARVASFARQLRLTPGAPDLIAKLIEAVAATTRDFSVADNSFGTRVLSPPAAQDFLARAPNAGIVALDNTLLPPYNTPLWDKVRQSDYGKLPLARITYDDVAGFRSAVSDTGFQVYRATLLQAFGRRVGEIRQTRESARAEIQRLRRRATELAHSIGSQDEGAGRLDVHVINIGLPTFGVVLIALLLVPRAYKSPELQEWIFTSGLLLEFTTLVLIVAAILILALAGRINEAIIGTVLGGVLGYGLGRGMGRRADPPAPAAVEPGRRPMASTMRR